jgi:hypothetical protein
MSNIYVELAKVQRDNGPSVYTVKNAHGPSRERKECIVKGKPRSCTWTKCCTTAHNQGRGFREEKLESLVRATP